MEIKELADLLPEGYEEECYEKIYPMQRLNPVADIKDDAK